MNTRRLGRSGPHVFPIALGCMGMSGSTAPPTRPRASPPSTRRSTRREPHRYRRLLRHGPQRDADRQRPRGGRARRLLCVKFGALRGPDGAWVGFDAPPARREELRSPTASSGSASTTSTSTARRGSTHRPHRGHHRRDRRPGEGRLRAPHRPVRGRRRDDPPRAAVHPIATCRSSTRSSAAAARPRSSALGELGIGVTAYGVLSRGLSAARTRPAGSGPTCRGSGREPAAQAGRRAEALAAGEASSPRSSRSPGCWQGPRIIPVIGARTREQLAESLGALDITLTSPRTNWPASRPRYRPIGSRATGTPPHRWRMLDSERRKAS